MISIVISGGQTGVDRAALDAAIKAGFMYSGWCPKGRLDEKGKIPERYSDLKEISGEFKTEKENYDSRTKLNIRDSDGTLIIVPKIPLPIEIKDGTLLTIQEVKKQCKHFLIIDLSNPQQTNCDSFLQWIKDNDIKILNVAGPRESTCPGIYNASFKLLEPFLVSCKNTSSCRPRL